MILAALVLQAVAGPAIGAIGRQDLPERGCAAYLWRLDDTGRTLGPVAMIGAEPPLLRIALDGRTLDLTRVAGHGDAGFGLASTADFRASGAAATLALTATTRGDLTDGAVVPQATLTVTRDGGDAIVVPLAGLIGCRRPQ